MQLYVLFFVYVCMYACLYVCIVVANRWFSIHAEKVDDANELKRGESSAAKPKFWYTNHDVIGSRATILP